MQINNVVDELKTKLHLKVNTYIIKTHKFLKIKC